LFNNSVETNRKTNYDPQVPFVERNIGDCAQICSSLRAVTMASANPFQIMARRKKMNQNQTRDSVQTPTNLDLGAAGDGAFSTMI
jgi:hypothetical protein